jgi:nucleoside-diphosphate-sugar epimerase
MPDFFAGKRTLITGGLGFIGSNLAHALVERGAEVTLLDSMLPAYGANLFNVDGIRDRVRINFSDVRDVHSLPFVVRDTDLIFSLAGQVSHLSSMTDPHTDLEINCRSQLSLLECCRRDNPEVKIVFASTRQLYGRPRYLPVDEDHPCVPVDVNGINNLAAEMYYRLYFDVHGIRTVSLRLTNTYGPRMDLRSADKGVVGVFLRNALTGKPLELFGSGGQRRDFNFVDDVIGALLDAARVESATGKVFNLGHPKAYTLLDLARQLQRLTGCSYECVPFPAEQRTIDIGDYWGSYDRFRAATGWEPHVDLDEGMTRTVDFFRRHASEYLT